MNKRSTFKRIILIISILILASLLFIEIKILNQKDYENNQRSAEIEALQNEIKSEEDRGKELKKNNEQGITDEDYEELARSELGLIKKNEIVIKPR